MLIGILKCDRAPTQVINEIGDYEQVYQRFLHLADQTIRTKTFECHLGQFPDSEQLTEFDGWMITGSKYSAYQGDEFPWINQLAELIRTLDRMKKKLVGICFGHQIIALALGATVRQNQLGWGISVQSFELNQLGQEFFPDKTRLTMQYMHHDIVTDLQNSPLTNLGSSRHCYNQVLIKDNHILTFQGHPEYLPINVEILINLRRDKIPGFVISEGLRDLNLPTDQQYIAERVVDFFHH